MHDATDTCSCDCGVRATVPSGRTVSRKSKHDSKQLRNSEQNQSDRDPRASATSSGKVSTAVPHVPDVRTITRFTKRSINKTQNNSEEELKY